MDDADVLARAAMLATAFGSTTRLLMLRALGNHTLLPAHNAGEVSEHGICLALLARASSVSPPTALRHLEVLQRAALVTKIAVTSGRRSWTYYSRDETGISDALANVATTIT